MSATITLSAQPNTDQGHASDVLRAAYRQVFGNYHMMENDINPSHEALFMNGDLTVQGLVTALAQSDAYRRMFLEPSSPYRFVELNCKHLLGRPPRDQAEIVEHVERLANEGFEAEIESYTNSDEYLSSFGIDTVPHTRTNIATVGETTLAFARTKVLDPGYAGFDNPASSALQASLTSGNTPDVVNRKGVGAAGTIRINWTSHRQVGIARRSVQKSVVTQSSLSSTIQSIQKQGGRILSITNAS